MAEPLKIVIDDSTETVRVDPVTGTVEEDQPGGGIVVHLDAKKPRTGSDDDDWYSNLAIDLNGIKLGVISNDLIGAIEADDRSRQESLENYARGLEMLGTKLERPSSGVGDSVEGMSKVTNPLMLEAVLKSWANAQAELLPSSGPVKIKDDGTETKGDDELAEMLERGMNHYLTKTAREYYPDTSYMLLWGTVFRGSGFKKIYRCPMRRRPVSESVDAKDLIVSDTTKDLASCARITHQIMMRPSVMKRMKLLGAYRDTELTQPTPTPSVVDEKIAGIQGTEAKPSRPEDQPYTIWEAQCELDIPEFAPGKFADEGIPLPYLVTIDHDSREVLAIRRDWDEHDEECERQRMYVRYPYVPGPGFYGTGLLNILGNSSAAMTAAWRASLDTGMYANFPAGLIAKLGGRQNSSTFRLSPGQFEPVETNGQPIGQIVMGLPYKDVTPGLLALIDKIVEQSRALGGAAEVPAGEGLANVPVGTMLAQIEQATKVMASAHKGMHQAQSEEFELLIELFRRNPEDFWRHNKECPKDYWTEAKLMQALDACQLVPVSDPNVPSHIHRVAKALGLVQLSAMPQFASRLDPDEVLRRVLAAMREDPIGLMVAAPPQQADPEAMAKMVAAQAKMKEVDAKVGKLQFDQSDAQNKHALKQAELAAQKEIKTADITKELIIHQADQEKLKAAERRDDIALRSKLLLEEHQEGLKADEQRKRQGFELVKHGLESQHADREHQHERESAMRDHGLAALTADREHGLAMAKHALEADKAAHEAALNVHQALNPPKPAAPAKPKGKK